MQKFLKWSHTHAGLISVAGALILFFSWVVSSTIKEDAAAARATYEHALERGDIDALLQQIQTAVYYPEPQVPPELKADLPRLDRLRARYSWAMLESHEVRGLASEMIRLEQMTRSLTGTKLRADVQAFGDDVRAVDGPLRKLAEAASEYAMRIPKRGTEMSEEDFKRGSDAMDALEKHIADLYSGTRIKVLSKDAGRLQTEAILALHVSWMESAERAAKAKKWAIGLYIVGSVVALFGQVLDKGKFFKDETVATSTSTTKTVAKKTKQR